MGIGFGAKAQSCTIANDGTYIAVDAYVSGGYIECQARCYGESQPSSGTIYVTVYYINGNENEDYEVITINWTRNENGVLGRNGKNGTLDRRWKGRQPVNRIKRWEVSAGACQFKQ